MTPRLVLTPRTSRGPLSVAAKCAGRLDRGRLAGVTPAAERPQAHPATHVHRMAHGLAVTLVQLLGAGAFFETISLRRGRGKPR